MKKCIYPRDHINFQFLWLILLFIILRIEFLEFVHLLCHARKRNIPPIQLPFKDESENNTITHTLQECPLLAACSSFQLESVRALVSGGKLYSSRVRHRISRDPDRTWYSMNLNWSTL